MKHVGATRLAIALVLALGACRQGPTLELGDDRETVQGGSGDAREDDDVGRDGAVQLEDGRASAADDAAARDAGDAEPECETEACEEEQPCAEDESCEACIDDADCSDPERSICNGERCVECTADEHCVGTEHTFCDIDEGQCE